MSMGKNFTTRPANLQEAGGAFSSLNPTRGFVSIKKGKDGSDETTGRLTDDGYHSGVFQVWSSRANRKGRHPIAIDKDGSGKAVIDLPPVTNNLRGALRGIVRMFVWYPVWDVSYDVAILFTIGSVIWVINSFFVWLPLAAPSTEFDGEVTSGGGITAFIGATIFEIGSVLLILEAVNENRADCFGWAIGEALEGGGRPLLRPHRDGCNHSHPNKRALLKKRTNKEDLSEDEKTKRQQRSWTWWPSWYELRTHYFKEIGFLACFSQLIGATVFWISGFTGLPPIYNSLSVPLANGVYWLPQVIGGTGFIVSSWLFMLETQHSWYIPNLYVLGWHIGFWNLIGAIGFTLCGALGFGSADSAVEYASTLATFIGSWAFLIGSVIQWFESLHKYPVASSKKAT